VVQAVSCDHECAPAECDRHFNRVGRKSVSEPCRSGNAAKTAQHHQENGNAAVLTKSDDQRYRAEERYQQRNTAVYAFLRGQEVCSDCREGQ
jgi:hypothetical protein